MAALGDRALMRRLQLDLLMIALTLVSVGLVLYEIVAETTIDPGERRLLDRIDLAIVAVFIAEFAWSASRSSNPWRYAREHWYDLPSMLPITSGMTRVFTGFRFLRLIRIIRLMRIIRAWVRIRRLFGYLGAVSGRAHLAYIGLVASTVVLLGAAAVYELEKDVNAQFATFGDALWWAIVTSTTVGYGDAFPITNAGRSVAAVLMVAGIGILGTLAGGVGAALLKTPDPPAPPSAAGRRRHLARHLDSGQLASHGRFRGRRRRRTGHDQAQATPGAKAKAPGRRDKP